MVLKEPDDDGRRCACAGVEVDAAAVLDSVPAATPVARSVAAFTFPPSVTDAALRPRTASASFMMAYKDGCLFAMVFTAAEMGPQRGLHTRGERPHHA